MKIQGWKNEKKAEKWIQIALGEEYNSNKVEEIYSLLTNCFGTAYNGFEEASIKGKNAFYNLESKIDEKIINSIINVAKENIKDDSVEITGYIDLKINASDGINIIKKSFSFLEDYKNDDDTKIIVSYIGAPRYRIKVISSNYKKAENILKKISGQIISNIEKKNGIGNFIRHI